jgi:hypothetical protein
MRTSVLDSMIRDLNSNVNSSGLQMIPRKHNFDFHCRTGGSWRTRKKCPSQPRASAFCRRNNVSVEESDVLCRKDNIKNVMWTKGMDKLLISFN